MPASLEVQLVVALSSRAQFDFEEANQVFEEQDAAAYVHLQLERMQQPAKSGVAFDGDAALFSDEAERVFNAHGLAAFQDHEERQALKPLPPGPFLPLLEALHRLRADGARGQRNCQFRLSSLAIRYSCGWLSATADVQY